MAEHGQTGVGADFSCFPSLDLNRKALLLLKKKRYQDQLLEKTENQISNLERMVSTGGGVAPLFEEEC